MTGAQLAMADLTIQAIQALKPRASHYKERVSKGLYIGVAKDGEKTFIVRYSVKGAVRDRDEYRIPKPFGLKSSPAHTTLAEARSKAAEILALGKQGIDYQKQAEESQKAEAAKAAEQQAKDLTVKDLYDAWFPTLKRKDKGKELDRHFQRDLLPKLGAIKLREVEESHIRTLLATISATGTNRKATMQLSLLKQMFGWANGRKPWKLLVDDPVINLKADDITQAGYKVVERDRVLSKEEITKLHRQMPAARLVKTTEALIWIALSCCTRVGETLKAQWQDIDLENLTWFIPESNTKGSAPAHTVHLSEFAAVQFRTLKALAGNSKWCFPNDDGTDHIGVKSPTKQIGDRQATLKAKAPLSKRSSAPSSLVVGSESWTPHDLRRTGMTLMQSLGVPEHVIERIANHIEQNKIKRIYQRYDYDAEKREAWLRLGTELTKITAS